MLKKEKKRAGDAIGRLESLGQTLPRASSNISESSVPVDTRSSSMANGHSRQTGRDGRSMSVSSESASTGRKVRDEKEEKIKTKICKYHYVSPVVFRWIVFVIWCLSFLNDIAVAFVKLYSVLYNGTCQVEISYTYSINICQVRMPSIHGFHQFEGLHKHIHPSPVSPLFGFNFYDLWYVHVYQLPHGQAKTIKNIGCSSVTGLNKTFMCNRLFRWPATKFSTFKSFSTQSTTCSGPFR